MVIVSLPQAGDNNQFITDLVFTYAPECAMLCSQQCPGCHPERLAVILSAAKDLCVRRASPFAALRACPWAKRRGDRHSLQMSSS